MKLLFLTIGRKNTPSTRFRVKQYVSHLKGNGVSCDIRHIPHPFYQRLSLLKNLGAYDAVIIQKKLFSPLELFFLSRANPNIIYDFDDLVTAEHPMHKVNKKVRKKMARNQKRFSSVLNLACGVIAGNEFLKENASLICDNVAIVPTPIDACSMPIKKVSAKEELTIGWIGTKSNLFYLDRFKDAWQEVLKKFPKVTFKIVCNKPHEIASMQIVNKEWREADETDDILSFDIGIMPLTDDDWSKGKCGFKLLQYMSAGLPTVSSPIGANRDIVTDGENGYLANSVEEWVDKLSLLLLDTKERERIGKNARKFVEENYCVTVCKDRLIDAIRGFIEA